MDVCVCVDVEYVCLTYGQVVTLVSSKSTCCFFPTCLPNHLKRKKEKRQTVTGDEVEAMCLKETN